MTDLAIRYEAIPHEAIERFIPFAKQAYIASYSYLWTPENLQHYLNLEYSRERIERFFDHPNQSLWWALLQDQPVGYAIAAVQSPIGPVQYKAAFLHRLYLLPQAQRKGIGQALCQQAEQFAHAAGETEIWLYCMALAPSVQFYIRNGYHIIRTTCFERIPMRSQALSDILVMKKHLTNDP
ncbi:MAG: GNAT family N-acetyltransferase [Bacteroidetes Order II. Incertae sedis bacterium]|nr:GNAT family N-acetyltransferase [Bacteroidetes Order II. bacterium]